MNTVTVPSTVASVERESDSNIIPNFQCKILAKAIKYRQTYTTHIYGDLRTLYGDDGTVR